jgi:hypothetical protein
VAFLAVIVPILLAADPGLAQQTGDELLRSLKRDVEALKEGQARAQRDLQEIKTLLQRLGQARPGGDDEPQPQNVVLSATDGVAKGEKSARLVLVDFTDYQ